MQMENNESIFGLLSQAAKSKPLEVLGISVAICALAVAVYEYSEAQKWKRSEFASRQVEKLGGDETISLAARALEWKNREFPLPNKYTEMYSGKVFKHDYEILNGALIPETKKVNFSKEEVVYQDIYDYYFDYLERVNHYIEIGLFSTKDVETLCYWVRLIDRPKPYYKGSFESYLKEYEFDGVFDLFEKCDPYY